MSILSTCNLKNNKYIYLLSKHKIPRSALKLSELPLKNYIKR